MHLYQVLIGPVVTEKAVRIQEKNQHTFLVHKDATKIDVMNAIRFYYDVHPESVQIIKNPKKERVIGRGRTLTKRKPVKKAVVRFPAGKSIELVNVKKPSPSKK